MAIYIVTYDLNREIHRPKIVDEIRKVGFARLSESSYAIDTAETPEAVHNRFKKYLDGNDDFFVITLSHPWTGYGPKAVIDWLTGRLAS